MLHFTKAGQVSGTRTSRMARGFALLAAAVFAVALAWPQTANAQVTCAGGECVCGAFILSSTNNVTLTKDIGPCSGQPGLRVERSLSSQPQPPPLTIDCQGHRIFSDTGTAIGIVNAGGLGFSDCSSTDCRQNVTVKNCVIEGFDVGIDYRFAYGWQIEGNTITGRWDGTTVYPAEVGIRGSSGRDPKSPTLVIDNDILEVTDTGIDLIQPSEGSEIRGNRVTAYVLNKQSVPKTNAGIRLELPRGESDNRIQVRGNYVDCPTRTDYNSTECNYYDLFIYTGYTNCPLPGTWLGWVDVYDNVFSGKGAYIDCDPNDTANIPKISFRPPLQNPLVASCQAVTDGFCDPDCNPGLNPPAGDRADCEARYNIFTNAFPRGTEGGGCTAGSPANTCDPDCKMTGGGEWDPECVGIPRPFYYDADDFLKACEAPSTWATTKVLTENTCFQPGQTYTFKPTDPADTNRAAISFGDHSSKYGTGPNGPNVGLILDCNWAGKLTDDDTLGKLILNIADLPSPGTNAPKTVGILAAAARTGDGGYIPRRRGTIVACEPDNFGTGIRLENSQDFLLRWNIVRRLYNNNLLKLGFFLDVKSDHLQDLDGDGDADPDPAFPLGVDLWDFRHQIYNPSFRPHTSSGGDSVQPFNWIGDPSAGQTKQVLYFYGSGADGLTIDGTDPYFGANLVDAYPNVGHLTAANVQNFTVQNFGGPKNTALGTPIASGDGVKFACVGMSHDDTTCSTRIEAPPPPPDPPPLGLINNVAVTGSQLGFYLRESYRVVLQNSRAGGSAAGEGNGYGVLMFGTASSTIGCNPVLNNNACPGGAAPGCNCLQNNDEGLWAAAWMLPATKVLVWGNSVSGNTRNGVVLYDADQSTVQNNTIADTGPCTSAGATVSCPAGFKPDAVGLYLYGANDGNVYGNTVSNSDGDNVLLLQSYEGRNAAALGNFLYSNTIKNSLAGRGIYEYNSTPNVKGNAFGWATVDGQLCPTAPAWPNSPCTGFSTDVWPMNLAPGSYHTTISGNARGSGMKLAYTNFDRLYRNKIEGNADGLLLYEVDWLHAVENAVVRNAGWGVVGWDERQNFVVRNQITQNGSGGMSFAAYAGANPGSTAVLFNSMDGNLGPGLQFHYATNYDVQRNVVRLPNTPPVPGVFIHNSKSVNLKGNTISSAAATPQFPYLTVSDLPNSIRSAELGDTSGSGFYDHHIYQSNTAGPESAPLTATYNFQDGVSPTASYNGTTDVTIDQTAPSANQNNISYLEVDGDVQQAAPRDDRRILLKWDISAIPSTCRVAGVSVTVYVPGSPADTTTPFGAYELKRAWIESGANGATWQTFDGLGNPWQQAGADGSQDRDSVDLAYIDAAHNGFGKNTAGNPCGLNSSCTNNLNAAGVQLVQDWVSTVKTNNGIIIMSNDGDADWNAFRFNRQETGAPNESQRPKLTVTCTMYPPVYYFYNNREHLEDNTDVALLGVQTVEKACLGNSLNYGHRCTGETECTPNTGATECLPLQTKHLQLAASAKFTVQNFTGSGGTLNRLIGADPLRADYMTETNFTGLELADCLGPCLALGNSPDAGGPGIAEFSLQRIVVSNPFGSGLVAAATAGVVATDLRIVPRSGQEIESNAIQLDDAGFVLNCPGGCATSLWDGQNGNNPSALPDRNELVRGTDAANRFWEMEMAPGASGDSTDTQFTDRGAFAVACQLGKDDCCTAKIDAVCDPDCGMKNGSDPVDSDCTGASVCTSAGGNCCLQFVDGVCDTDCPARVDPDCGMRAEGTPQGSGAAGDCSGNGVANGVCDYDCIQDASHATGDPDCVFTSCSSSKDGCCNPSDEPGAAGTPGAVCDPDCSLDMLDTLAGVGANIDPDCSTALSASSDDGCYPAKDAACDTDCPPGVDPDCGSNSTGLSTADGICNGVDNPTDVCDPDCIGGGNIADSDIDCRKKDVTSTVSLCTFRASFKPGNTISQGGGCTLVDGMPPDNDICDRDCLGIATPDPDCTEIDCCLPKIDGACDADCPAGLDPDCIRPAQWPPIVATCQPWRDGMCDYDCPSITFPTAPPDSICTNSTNQICDPDCIGNTVTPDPDCLQPDPDCPAALAVELPAVSGCNALPDGLCDQSSGCGAGVDPDCGMCGMSPPTGVVAYQTPDGRCDADCGLDNTSGIPLDPDCGYCSSGKDGCCNAAREYTIWRCDPDCSIKADGSPVDPDCPTGGCTNNGGDCCRPIVDGGCDADCPAGFDPDCSAKAAFCGDRSVQEANQWPAAYSIPYSDDVNYPYEKGIPNGADSCVAPLVRFKALSSTGDVDPPRIARQYRIPRTYNLKQRRWSRGDVFLEAQVGDFEGSDLKLGLMFSTEKQAWVDPINDGWYCSNTTLGKTAFWCAVSFFSAETAADQPLVPPEPPLPLPLATYFTGCPWGQGGTCNNPSVDNGASAGRIGPAVQRIGVATPIRTRQWPTVNTEWDSDYLSKVTFYWAAAASTYGIIRGEQTEGEQTGEPLDDRRQALWLELVSTDSGGCTETTNSGCFSGGGSPISLCDADCGAPFDATTDCQISCVTDDNDMVDPTKKTREGWSRRQRLVVDLKPLDSDSDPEPDAIQTLTITDLGGSSPHSWRLTWGPRPGSGTDSSTGLATVGGEVLKATADAASQSQYASWSPGSAHYEVWFGTNKDEVVQPWRLFCSDGDVAACQSDAGEGSACNPDGDPDSGTCRVGDGNAANGPFVWEDIPLASSGMPRETCTWESSPFGNLDGDCYDSKLADIYCNQVSPGLCQTILKTGPAGQSYFLVCAVDDFGNYEKSCKFSESSPWLQTQFGDIYAGQSLTATNQSVVPNATFLITTAGSIYNWSSASTAFGTGKLQSYVPPTNAQRALPFPTYKNDFTTTAGSIWFLRDYNGTNFNAFGGVLDQLRARYGNSRVVDLGATMCGGGASSLPVSGVLGGKVYYRDGPCTVASAQTFNNGTLDEDGSALFLINGSLTINSNIQYGGAAPTKLKNIASATWLVLGGVTIASAVTTVDSSIIALGSWANKGDSCDTTSAVACGTIETGSSDVFLKVRGIMAAREFLFQRTGSELYTGSEKIIYDGRLLANPPPGLDDLMQSLPVWKP